MLESVEDVAVFASCVYLLASDEEEEEEEDEEEEDEEEEDEEEEDEEEEDEEEEDEDEEDEEEEDEEEEDEEEEDEEEEDEEEEDEEEEDEEEEKEEDIRELLEIHEMITSCRYLSRKASASRVNIDILDTEYLRLRFLHYFACIRNLFGNLQRY